MVLFLFISALGIAAAEPDILLMDRSMQERVEAQLQALRGDIAVLEKGLPSVSDIWEPTFAYESESADQK